MLIDTDVIIWYMRGNEKAKKLITDSIGFHISVRDVYGTRTGDEEQNRADRP